MYDEEELIRDILKKRNRAVEALYDRHAPALLGVCLRYCGNREDAEDVLHDGFIKVLKNMHTFKSRDNGSFFGWMRTIMVNTALNFLRSRKKEMFNLPIDSRSSIADEPEEEETGFDPLQTDIPKDTLMEMIGRLPDGYRAVFNLYVFEDYSHKEIAGIMNFTENTSKSQLSKARAMLRKQLTEWVNKNNVYHEKERKSIG